MKHKALGLFFFVDKVFIMAITKAPMTVLLEEYHFNTSLQVLEGVITFWEFWEVKLSTYLQFWVTEITDAKSTMLF